MGSSLLTWAVTTQHPRLNQGCRHGDLVKQATVIIAGFLPWACDENLHSSLQRREKRWSSAPGGIAQEAPAAAGSDGAGLRLLATHADSQAVSHHSKKAQTPETLFYQDRLAAALTPRGRLQLPPPPSILKVPNDTSGRHGFSCHISPMVHLRTRQQGPQEGSRGDAGDSESCI